MVTSTIHLATIVAAGTALVLAPIHPATTNTPTRTTPTPKPQPATVHNYDNHGSYWGASTIAETNADITQAQLSGQHINEWHVTDPTGQPLRIVRIADPGFLDTISVIPA